MQSVQVKLWYPLTMHAIAERLRDASCGGAIQIYYLFTFIRRMTNVNWSYNTWEKTSYRGTHWNIQIVNRKREGKFFKLNVGFHSLRGHDYKLYKFRSRFNVRKFFFSQRVVDIRNSLCNHVVEADSVNSFKRRLEKCKEWGI